MSSFTLSATRRACLAVLSLGALLAPFAAHAQLQEITYLLPAPGTLPAFGPWMLAQAKGCSLYTSDPGDQLEGGNFGSCRWPSLKRE